jgi:hypothetical protein
VTAISRALKTLGLCLTVSGDDPPPLSRSLGMDTSKWRTRLLYPTLLCSANVTSRRAKGVQQQGKKGRRGQRPLICNQSAVTSLHSELEPR